MLAQSTPAPSMRALRILRSIAYFGTFGGTAFLMEDRRRRIRMAREVQKNAKILRSFRQYHGLAAAVAEHDIQVPPEYEDQEPIEHAKHTLRYVRVPPRPFEVQKTCVSAEQSRLQPPRGVDPLPPPPSSLQLPACQRWKWDNTLQKPILPVETSNHHLSDLPNESTDRRHVSPLDVLAPEEVNSTSKPSLCDQAARHISRFLKNKDLSAAGNAYFTYFESDPSGREINKNLEKAALRLSFATEKAHDYSMVQRIHDQLPNSGLPSPRQKIEELLASSRVHDAVKLFLQVFEKEKAIHEKTSSLGSRLCWAALPLGLYEDIEAVFWRLHSTGAVHKECWNATLEAIAERRLYGQVRVVYNMFKDQYPLSRRGYECVIRALAAQSRLDDVRELLTTFFKSNGQPENLGYARVLEEIWRATKNFEWTKNIFEDMRSWSSVCKHQVPSYNTMISICVEAGQGHEAHAYYKEMTDGQGLKANIQTQGHFILAQALSGNWKMVEVMLDSTHSTGISLGYSKAFLSNFNRLLREHVKHHAPRETELFFWRAVHKYGIVPNNDTSEIIVTGHVRSGDMESVYKWFRSVEKYGLTLDSSKLSAMFKHYWHTSRVDHKKLWNVYRDLKTLDKGLVSEQFLNVMRDAISYDLRKGRPEASKRYLIAGRLVRLGREGVNPDIHDTKFTQRQMLLAMSLGEPLKAVQIYNESKSNGIPLSSTDLEVAVECSIRGNHGDFEEAIDLLRSAEEAGMNVQGALTPVLIHDTFRQHEKEDHLIKTAMDFYNLLERSNIRIKHHVAVATAYRLVTRGDFRGAVHFLDNVLRLPLAEKRPFDIVGMTVLLRAYGALRDLGGVEWVIRTVFRRNLRIDMIFLTALKDVRKPLSAMRKTLAEGSDAFLKFERLSGLLETWIVESRHKMRRLDRDAKRQGKAMVNVIRRLHTAQTSDPAPKALSLSKTMGDEAMDDHLLPSSSNRSESQTLKRQIL